MQPATIHLLNVNIHITICYLEKNILNTLVLKRLAQTMLSSISDRRFSPWSPVQYSRAPKNGQVGALLTTGRIKMKIAIPVFHTKISPRFDSTQEFILLKIEQRSVIAREQLSTGGWPLAAKVKQLVNSGVDTLICGGIDRESLQHLSFNGLKVYSWVTGEVEDAITCFLDHGLESGIILGTQGTPQGRWLFCERRNHMCNMAQTEFRCEGKEVMRMPARDGTGPMGRNRRAGKYRNRNQADKCDKNSDRGKGRNAGQRRAEGRQKDSRRTDETITIK